MDRFPNQSTHQPFYVPRSRHGPVRRPIGTDCIAGAIERLCALLAWVFLPALPAAR